MHCENDFSIMKKFREQGKVGWKAAECQMTQGLPFSEWGKKKSQAEEFKCFLMEFNEGSGKTLRLHGPIASEIKEMNHNKSYERSATIASALDSVA